MRLFLFFLIFCYGNHIPPGNAALSKAALQDTKKMMKGMCKRSSGVKQDLLTKMHEGDFIDDPKLKCYIHCCLRMMKTMKNDKITAPEATRQIEMLLPADLKEPSLKQLNSCKDVDGADACDKAFNFAKCCHEVDQTNWLIPT